MRPIELAREHGLSTQAIRNYEDAGILPPGQRSATGYRAYTARHAQALRTFLALRRGHGYQHAAEIMRAVHRGDHESGFRLIDAAHADLLAERATHAETAATLGTLSRGAAPPVAGHALSVGELGRRLGVHPATLRSWEAAGILAPHRRATGHREYRTDDVREAEIAAQLRRGGYRLRQVAQFLASLREAGGAEALAAFVQAWQLRLTTRGRHLLAGAGQLDAYLNLPESSPPHGFELGKQKS